MSRSEAYRPVHLSEEVRRELAERCRENRQAHVLPRLRAHIHSLAERRCASPATVASLLERVDSTVELGELRRLAVDITRAPNASSEQGGGLGRPAWLGHRTNDASAVEVSFDLERCRAQLRSLEQEAAQLGLRLADTEVVAELLADTDRALAGGRVRASSTSVGEIDRKLRAMDGAVLDALAAAECRAKAVEAASRALIALGYEPHVDGLAEQTTVLRAVDPTGASAEVVVTSIDDEIGVTSTFTDPASAVPVRHPDADALCEPAVAHQVEFSRHLATPDLLPDRPEAAERPSRSSLRPVIEPPPTRRRRGAANPNHRRLP